MVKGVRGVALVVLLVACTPTWRMQEGPRVHLPHDAPSLPAPLSQESRRGLDLRGQVGERTREPSSQFALRVLRSLGVLLREDLLRTPDGVALARMASQVAAITREIQPLAGDLVLFQEGRLWGVVTAVRENGTVEFVYADRGVVRRGFVHPSTPSLRRDDRGRVLNTFVRPYHPSDGPGQRYLAGELLTGFVRLDKLVQWAMAEPSIGSEAHLGLQDEALFASSARVLAVLVRPVEE
ncbi:MAG: hypothetical protein HY698_21880 [Deltaproteobacteria bacterium]|nr:hypothetical protein [Deltaproteobacteria bacterium]